MQTAQGTPFLMMADSAQAMATNIAGADINTYLDTRASQGFNAIQFDLIATPYISNNNANYATIDGIRPFTSTLLTTPNPTYFALMDTYIQKCAALGMVAILNPYECGGGLPDLVTGGTGACTSFGNYLGSRYASFSNIIWQLGNDLDITTQTDFNVVQALAAGILANDPNHLMTIELYFLESTAFDNTGGFGSFASLMSMNGSYTGGPTYGYDLLSYNKITTSFAGQAGTNTTPQKPSILLESNYEFEANPSMDGGSPLNLRKQNYWTALSGLSGLIYGNGYVWGFETSGGSNIAAPGGVGGTTGSWKNNLATTGATQLLIWKNFFNAIPWQNLIPDQTHVIGTAGYGTPALTGLFAANNYVTVAATTDGHYAVAYFPLGNSNTLTINMTKMAGTVTAQWFDPTNGAFTTVSGSPFSNTGTHNFTPTGNNSAGDPDWVLSLTA